MSSEERAIEGAPGGPFQTEYTYDAMDRPVTMTMPDTEVITTTYNVAGLPVTLAGDETYVTGTSYNALGQVTRLDLGNGISTTCSYYSAATGNNRLQQIQVGGGSLLALEYSYDNVGNVVQIVDVDGQAQTQTQSFVYDALDRLTGASAQAGGPWAAYSGSYEYDRVGNLRLKAEGGITHTMQYSDTAHVHAVSAVNGVPQTYDANGNMTVRVVDGVTYAQGWDHENRLVWASTGGVTTTFTYDANGALVKKEDPLVGTTYYVGPHYEVLVPAVILPPAPTDLEACRASGSPPNVCNDLTWSGSSGATYNIYRSTTSPVPIDVGHLVTSGITETNYTDCGNVYNRYYAVTAVNENGESAPSNEDRASESCGSSMAATLPVLNTTALTESGGEPVITKYVFFGGKRVAMRKDNVLCYLAGDQLGTTSLVLNANGTVHSEARHYPYGEERWSSGTLPTDYRFTGQRIQSGLGLYHMGARHDDPYINRFISPDSIIPQPGNPQSLNRYSYGYNNPVKFRDPNGHQACEAGDDACWERRWYQAHGYEYLEGQWLYTGSYFFADKFILAETLVEIGLGYHQINQLTSFGFSDGSVSYSLVQRGQENELSRILGSFAFALDAVDFAITGSVAAAYTIEQIVTAAVGGPPGALVGLLAGDGGYKLMNMGLLGVDSLALLSIAGADFASGMSGFDASAQQAWIGCDTLVSAATLSVSAGSTALPVAPGIYLSLAGDVVQMTYDFLRAAGILSGYSLQIQW